MNAYYYSTVYTSMCVLTSSLECGFVSLPNGQIFPLDFCSLEQACHGEGGIPPKDYGFVIEAGREKRENRGVFFTPSCKKLHNFNELLIRIYVLLNLPRWPNLRDSNSNHRRGGTFLWRRKRMKDLGNDGQIPSERSGGSWHHGMAV